MRLRMPNMILQAGERLAPPLAHRQSSKTSSHHRGANGNHQKTAGNTAGPTEKRSNAGGAPLQPLLFPAPLSAVSLGRFGAPGGDRLGVI